MKLYEVEVIAKITIHGTTELEAKVSDVNFVKEKIHADEAVWLSCREEVTPIL